jgi:hypothetical protein
MTTSCPLNTNSASKNCDSIARGLYDDGNRQMIVDLIDEHERLEREVKNRGLPLHSLQVSLPITGEILRWRRHATARRSCAPSALQ